MSHYIDFHIHSPASDGLIPAETLIERANAEGIRALAITDHNYLTDTRQLQEKFPQMTLISGAEISAVFHAKSGKKKEVHILGLGMDPENKEIAKVLSRNNPDLDRRLYVEAILQKLKNKCGIDIGSFEDLRANSPSKHIGRVQIAEALVKGKYVKTQEEAFDRFIGERGERLAYVEPPLNSLSMEEIVHLIRRGGGVPVLAHILYYRLDDDDIKDLLRQFKVCGGEALEVFYGAWSADQRQAVKALADEYGLMYSAGSDFHGRDVDRLDHHFELTDCLHLVMTIVEKQHMQQSMWKHGDTYVSECAMIEELRNRPNGVTVVETNDGTMRNLVFSLSKEAGGHQIIPFSKITRALVDAIKKGEPYRTYVDEILLQNSGATILISDVVHSATGQALGQVLNEYAKDNPVLLGCRNVSELYYLMAEIENGNMYSYVGTCRDFLNDKGESVC